MFLRNRLVHFFHLDGEIERLKGRLRELETELSQDENFGILNRNGLLHFANKQPRGITRHLVLIDIDHLHELNHRYGYEEMNRRIRSMFSIPVQGSDCFVGKFFSGDEVLCVAGVRREDAEAIVKKLEVSAAENGISFTWVMGVWKTEEDIAKVALTLAQMNLEKKVAQRRRLAQTGV